MFYSSFLCQWYFPVYCTYLHASPAAINQTAALLFFLSLHNCSIHTYVPSALEHCVLTLLLLDLKTISIFLFLDPVHKSDAAGEEFVSARSLRSHFPVDGCWYSNPFRANKLPANCERKQEKKWIRSSLEVGKWDYPSAIVASCNSNGKQSNPQRKRFAVPVVKRLC